jgi:hypothetical protein
MRPKSPRLMRLTASVSRTLSRRSASGVDAGHSAVAATGVSVVRVSAGTPPVGEGLVGVALLQPPIDETRRTVRMAARAAGSAIVINSGTRELAGLLSLPWHPRTRRSSPHVYVQSPGGDPAVGAMVTRCVHILDLGR